MADEILKEEAAKEAAQREFKLDAGLLTEEELAEFIEAWKKEQAKIKEIKLEELKKAEEELKTVEILVNEKNLASFLYTSSKVQLNDSSAKAAELTAFIEALLRPGIYPSVGEAYEEGVPVGTFIIVDDPNTDATEFKIEVVTEPVLTEETSK